MMMQAFRRTFFVQRTVTLGSDGDRCKFMADQFWRHWIREYLQTLQVRQKCQDMKNIAVDDVVLLYDEHQHRKW